MDQGVSETQSGTGCLEEMESLPNPPEPLNRRMYEVSSSKVDVGSVLNERLQTTVKGSIKEGNERKVSTFFLSRHRGTITVG